MYTLEKLQNIKLPRIYKDLDLFTLKNIKRKIIINNNLFMMTGFMTIYEIKEELKNFYEFLSYDLIPIIKTNFTYCYICLYYKNNRKNPLVVYLDYDFYLEINNIDESIIILYQDIEVFFKEIKIL